MFSSMKPKLDIWFLCFYPFLHVFLPSVNLKLFCYGFQNILDSHQAKTGKKWVKTQKSTNNHLSYFGLIRGLRVYESVLYSLSYICCLKFISSYLAPINSKMPKKPPTWKKHVVIREHCRNLVLLWYSRFIPWIMYRK